MDAQTYSAMMALLQEIDGKVDAIVSQQEGIGDRLAKAERNISKLWLAVFGGGTGLIATVWYLLQIHVKP